MRSEAIALVAVMLPTITLAQNITQRPVRTEKITGAVAGVGLYSLDPDGTVLIDWHAVEASAIGVSDHMSMPVARMMLAIRDGKWKPMPR